MLFVPLREHRLVGRPGHADFRIVPQNPEFSASIVHVGALVFDLRDVADDSEPVRESWWDVTLLEVVGRQCHAYPLPEGWGTTAHVDRDVEDLAFDHAN